MNADEQKLYDLAPLMRDTILAWEASVNATTREETERLYIKAAYMRKRVMDALEDLPGGGGAVEKPGITPLPSAAGPSAVAEAIDELDLNERQKLRFEIGRSMLGVPIKGQDGSPNDKTEIITGIMDGFAQPLPNLDHIINRRVPPPFMFTGPMGELLAYAIPTPSIDDDLDDVPLGKACSIDNPGCDSCQ